MTLTRAQARARANHLPSQPILIKLYTECPATWGLKYMDEIAFTRRSLLTEQDYSALYDMIANINTTRGVVNMKPVDVVSLVFDSAEHYTAWKEAAIDQAVYFACLDTMFNVEVIASHPRMPEHTPVYELN